MPMEDQPLDNELLDLHAETQCLALTLADAAMSARLVEIAGELLELACGDARSWQARTSGLRQQEVVWCWWRWWS
jgi:hypothetical protein